MIPIDVTRPFTRQIGCHPREYERGLYLAYPDGVSGGPMEFSVTSGAVTLHITLEIGPERRIALMRLPTLIAHFQFEGGTVADREGFLRHLDLATQRGGG
jgi:hypothetical protein